MVGQCLAALIGAVIGALLTRSLAPEALDSWGWRGLALAAMITSVLAYEVFLPFFLLNAVLAALL